MDGAVFCTGVLGGEERGGWGGMFGVTFFSLLITYVLLIMISPPLFQGFELLGGEERNVYLISRIQALRGDLCFLPSL